MRMSTIQLIEEIARMASAFAYTTEKGFYFSFPEIGAAKRYCPDSVWFDGVASEKNAAVIFEVDNGTSPKHRAGGAALANIVALKNKRRLHYFAIAPPEHERVAKTSVQLLEKYLDDKWQLVATVIPSFEPKQIRARIAGVLRSERPTLT